MTRVLGTFLVDSNAMVFGMPSALFPALAEQHFGGGAATVGYLYAAPYAGALACSLTSGWTSHVRRQGIAVLLAAGTWGAAVAGFGFMDSLWPALAMLAVAGGADLVSAVFRSAMLLSATTESMRGRLAGHAEVLRRRDDAASEMVLPDPIDDYPGRERVLGARQPAGECQPAATRAPFHVRRPHCG